MAESRCELCYRIPRQEPIPLFALCLPMEECNYDEVLPDILRTIDASAQTTHVRYELIIFCAGGRHRPSWPWLIQTFSRLDTRYKKGLSRLYLVHEKSWVRVCMQLLENLVSPKFAKKVVHIKDLEQLYKMMNLGRDTLKIPTEVIAYDQRLFRENRQTGKRRKQQDKDVQSRNTAIERRTSEKRPLLPPVVPARTTSRNRSPTKETVATTRDMPLVPPRRSVASADRQSTLSAESIVIFEDPMEAQAAEEAAMHLQKVLMRSVSQSEAAVERKSTSGGQRSSSAPVMAPPRVPNAMKSNSKAPTTLKRAISGPLTPSSSLKQNFLPPLNHSMPPPKIKIHGRDVVVKTKTANAGMTDGKVGGLKALFEQKALVAQSMR